MTKKSKQILTKTRDFNWIGERKLQRNGALPRATGPPLSQHLNTKNNTSCKNNFSLTCPVDSWKQSWGLEVQFTLLAVPYKPLGYCLPKNLNCDLICNFWKFCKGQTFAYVLFTDFPAWFDPLIKLNINGLLTDLGVFTSLTIFSFYSSRVQ